jgi:hypothetical protein
VFGFTYFVLWVVFYFMLSDPMFSCSPNIHYPYRVLRQWALSRVSWIESLPSHHISLNIYFNIIFSSTPGISKIISSF